MAKMVRFELKGRSGNSYNGILQFDGSDEVRNVWVFFAGKSGIVQDSNRIVGNVRKPLLAATELSEHELVWAIQSAAGLHKSELPTTEELTLALMSELEAWKPGAIAELVPSNSTSVATACLALNIPTGLSAILRNLRLEPRITSSYATNELLNAQLQRSWRIAKNSEGGVLSFEFLKSTNAGSGAVYLLRRAGLGVARRLKSETNEGATLARG